MLLVVLSKMLARKRSQDCHFKINTIKYSGGLNGDKLFKKIRTRWSTC